MSTASRCRKRCKVSAVSAPEKRGVQWVQQLPSALTDSLASAATQVQQRVTGKATDAQLDRYREIAQHIMSLAPGLMTLSDKQLAAKTREFRSRLSPEALQLPRPRHYEVQLMGAIAMHEGHVAEMQTGEGKTLVAICPLYLNALTGHGVHLVTVNPYLAARDQEWVGSVLRFLGLSVGLAQDSDEPMLRREAFKADVTYTTPSTVAFAYLRDNNLVTDPEHLELARPLHFALVDEADYLMIDQAVNPFLLSSAFGGGHSSRAAVACQIVQQRAQGTGQKENNKFSDPQTSASATIMDLWEDDTLDIAPWGVHLATALRAEHCYLEDVDYIIKDGAVKIIDQASGRIQEKTRWTDLLHTAVEYKHHLDVEMDQPTLCSITVQGLCQLYPRLAGMTGTASTESEELYEVYGLATVSIPTNQPCVRVDRMPTSFLYRPAADRYLCDAVATANDAAQPVLIGTGSVNESNKLLSALHHWVPGLRVGMLNAQPHLVRQEAQIIAQAGLPGTVTIATNMAGRGTDIILGGNTRGLVHIILAQYWYRDLVQDEAELRSLIPVPQSLVEFDSGGMAIRERTSLLACMRAGALSDTLRESDARLKAAFPAGISLEGCESLMDSVLKRVAKLSRKFQRALGPGAERAGVQQFKLLSQQLREFSESELGPFEVATEQGEPVALDLMDARTRQEMATRYAVHAALLLWLWIDLRCRGFEAQVKAAGGLLVISASAQPNQRSVLQLRGRAGRRGDPGASRAFVSYEDEAAKLLQGKYNLADIMRILTKSDDAFEEPLPRLKAVDIQRLMETWLEAPRREMRRYSYQEGQAVNTPKQIGYHVRRSILTGSHEQRTQMLHSYFYAYAEEVVASFIDASQPPEQWHGLAEMVAYIRLVVNPREAQPNAMPMTLHDKYMKPNGLRALDNLRQNIYHGIIPLANVGKTHVLGDASAEHTATSIQMGLRGLRGDDSLPSNHGFHQLPVHIQAELLERRQASEGINTASPFSGRWAREARRLAAHLAEDLVVAWSCLRLPSIREAFKPFQAAFHLSGAGTKNTVEAWQMSVMLHALDVIWADFLNDCTHIRRSTMLRSSSSAPEARLEFEAESGLMFVRLMERFRRKLRLPTA
ncbi:hypothetical protein WJX73_001031 [Symbiochloris irregularis]|uniref:chloroplast protein-transporting ATPase n=1 Tax=Symbiochloris irregularis TaxID=706552 RepID=A0AAW1NNL0_9CHLO